MAKLFHKRATMLFFIALMLLVAAVRPFKIHTKVEQDDQEDSANTNEQQNDQASNDHSNDDDSTDEERNYTPIGETIVLSTNDSKESILLSDVNMQNSVRSAYEHLRDKFDLHKVTIDTTENTFTLTVRGTGYTTIEKAFDFLDEVDDSTLLDVMQENFSMEETIQLATCSGCTVPSSGWEEDDACCSEKALECTYRKTEDDWGSFVRSCTAEFIPLSGFYKVEALKINIEHVLIETDDAHDESKGEITFGGHLNFDDGSEIETTDTLNMDDKLVSFRMTLDESQISELDKDEPSFHWTVSPSDGQMSVNLLLTALDQTVYEDQVISEGALKIIPPRGLSSLNTLSISEAEFDSTAGKFSNLKITCVAPAFDFLPLGLTTEVSSCVINYDSSDAVSVEIKGEVALTDGSAYYTRFSKKSDSDIYTIHLTAEEGTTLSFETIKSQIFPTITTEETTILPDDEFSLEKLALINLSEDDGEILDPYIKIRLEPYLFYEVTGYHHAGIVANEGGSSIEKDMHIQADFVNLDGTVFSYIYLTADSSLSSQAFEQFLPHASTDGGFSSLEIDGFNIIVTNRDFNLDSIDVLANANIEGTIDYNILLKKGISVQVSTYLINDCQDFTFCRILKSNEVYSQFLFEGDVHKERTSLTSDIDNFALPTGVSFNGAQLHMRIIEHDGQSRLEMDLTGDLVTVVEEDRALVINAEWSFSSDPTDDITLTGTLDTGIYDDVFKLALVDLTDVRASGTIDAESGLNDFTLGGLGVYGHDCYHNLDLISDLQSQNSDLITETVNIGEYSDGGSEADVIEPTCKTAYFKVSVDREDYTNNRLRGVIEFDSPEDILRTSISVKTDDHIPDIINDITFPYGLILDYVYSDSLEDRPVSFVGEMEFQGVRAQGQFDLHIYDHSGKANLILPTIKIGGGNVQFITREDLIYHYGLDEDHFKSNDLDKLVHYDDLMEDNTLKFELLKDQLSESTLLLESNLLMFEMITRTATYLTSDLMSFTVSGHPYNGVFDATTTVEIEPVSDLQAESNSAMEMIISQDDKFEDLGDETNSLLQSWVRRIIRVTEEASRLRSEMLANLNARQDELVPENECEAYEQCVDLPTIKCADYAQTAKCIRSQDACVTMNQECTSQVEYCTTYTSQGECRQSITRCTEWSNYCENGETQEVCLEYENQDDLDECLSIELSCTYSVQKDAECVATSRELQQEIDHIQADIAAIDSFLENIQQLKDSSVCVLKRSKENDEFHECSDQDDELTDIQDDIDLLDLVEISSSVAEMQLREVVASDEIVFHTDLYLNGDWTNKYNEIKDTLVIRHDLEIEEEDADKGYTNGAKSLVEVSHTVNFESVEQTAKNIFEVVKMIVCREYEIGSDRSHSLQVSITEFDLLDGDDTICPPFMPIDEINISHGLHSEQGNEDVDGVNDDGSLAIRSYEYTANDEDIDLTAQQIADYNTLNFEEQQANIGETLGDAIEDGVSEDPEETLPIDEASEAFTITDDEHGSDVDDLPITPTEEARVDQAARTEAAHEAYAEEIHENQEEIDEMRQIQLEAEEEALAQARAEEDANRQRMEHEKQDAEANQEVKESTLRRPDGEQRGNVEAGADAQVAHTVEASS